MKLRKKILVAVLALSVAIGGAEMYKASNQKNATEEKETTQTNINKQNKCRKAVKVRAKLTAYCPCRQCSEGYGYNTASGKRARVNHTIAVDRRKIRLGTKVKIGGKTYVAEDVGGGVKGYHIDIFMKKHRQTQRFGVKYKNIIIYKK